MEEENHLPSYLQRGYVGSLEGYHPKSVAAKKLSAFVGSQVNTKAFFDEVDEDKSGSISKVLASDSSPVGGLGLQN